ncbi:tetratricopeptide repeat protein [Burkholderia vietnamiensis]|uniref:tetratricopeptide repeat protein n=1 Tax=Burkholderia vietnamiensis TaxID=60552 RepID=UPI001CF134AA|nr:tetratricopeptide repeat protein [Burkholderia vietnamiensis]MCA8148187.1 sel1 repeat family protein [Burkholderia vietnamiensis]
MSTFQEQIAQVIQNQDCYFLGDALPPDWYAGFKLWLPMAEAGDPKAMLNVGYCLTYGYGVDEDKAAGLDWYRRLARLGDPRGMLAVYYQLKNTQPDVAEPFLHAAVATGDARAKRWLSDREWQRDEQARKAKETHERQETLKRSTSAVSDLKALLGRGDNQGARRRAEQAVQDGLTWAGSIVAATSLQVNVSRSSRKHHTIVQGAATTVKVVEGVYSTGPVTTSHREYTYRGTVTNPTAYPVTISFGGGRNALRLNPGETQNLSNPETRASTWPDDCTVGFDDPAGTWATMKIKGVKAARTSSGGGKVWKILGTIVALYIAMRVYNMWVFYQHWHGH